MRLKASTPEQDVKRMRDDTELSTTYLHSKSDDKMAVILDSFCS